MSFLWLMQQKLGLAIFLVVVGSGALIYWVLRVSVLKPIQAMTEFVDSYAEQHYLKPFAKRNDQIGHLQKTLYRWAVMQQAQSESLRIQAYTDGLTGIPNRHALLPLMRHTRHSLVNDEVMVLFFLDLDGFKQVNDLHGHDQGDQLLKKITQILLNLIGIEDHEHLPAFDKSIDKPCLIRLGGDEFTVLVRHRQPYDPAILANKILEQFRLPFHVDGRQMNIGVSIGIASIPEDTLDEQELIKFADTAMYAAKSRGKMCYAYYDQALMDENMARIKFESMLHHALDHDEIVVWFQPKVDPDCTCVKGFEALVRIDSKEHGLIFPDQFISIAEKTGLIDYITLRVTEKCCQAIHTIKKELGIVPTMAINVSPVQMHNHQLFDELNELLASYRIKPQLIEWEITENSLIDREQQAGEVIARLQQHGYSVALDDFGVGYSSLSYLKHMNFDTLKIDRLFFQELETDATAEAILVSIMTMAKNLDMTIVAEGIETESQLEFVRFHQVHLVQGYYYARPQPLDQLLAYLHQQKTNCVA